MESFYVVTTTIHSETHTFLYLLIRSFPGMKQKQHSLKQFITVRTQCTLNSMKVCLHWKFHFSHVRSTDILCKHPLYYNASCHLNITSYVSSWVGSILKNINDKNINNKVYNTVSAYVFISALQVTFLYLITYDFCTDARVMMTSQTTSGIW